MAAKVVDRSEAGWEIPKSKWGKSNGAVVEEIPKSIGEGKPVDRAPTEEGPATEDRQTCERRGTDWCSVGGGAGAFRR